MTRKDYQLIAQAMNDEIHGDIDPHTWMSIVNSLASALGKENERFNRDTFRNACGWKLCTGLESQNV